MPNLGGGLFGKLPGIGSTKETKPEEDYDYTGTALRIFSSKKNRFVGKHLPSKGVCIKKITVEGNNNWYVLQLEDPIHLNNYHPHLFIIKPINNSQSLDEDKVQIYFLFIPDEKILKSPDINIRSLLTAGKVFSRPINL